MEAVAKHDFNATAEDELSFRRGQTLKVLNMDEDQNWYRAELDNREGMIPSNYIKMKDNSWYLGKISRVDAENLLLRQRNEGVFLVRASESTPGDFSLSVKCGDSAQHFKVLRDEQGKYFLWMRRFNSLNELVEYHKTTSVTRNQPDVKLRDPDRQLQEALVIAEYDFAPQEPNEIAFKRGDIIIVVSKQHPHWWEGEIRGKRGLFPNSYVSPYLQQPTK